MGGRWRDRRPPPARCSQWRCADACICQRGATCKVNPTRLPLRGRSACFRRPRPGGGYRGGGAAVRFFFPHRLPRAPRHARVGVCARAHARPPPGGPLASTAGGRRPCRAEPLNPPRPRWGPHLPLPSAAHESPVWWRGGGRPVVAATAPRVAASRPTRPQTPAARPPSSTPPLPQAASPPLTSPAQAPPPVPAVDDPLSPAPPHQQPSLPHSAPPPPPPHRATPAEVSPPCPAGCGSNHPLDWLPRPLWPPSLPRDRSHPPRPPPSPHRPPPAPPNLWEWASCRRARGRPASEAFGRRGVLGDTAAAAERQRRWGGAADCSLSHTRRGEPSLPHPPKAAQPVQPRTHARAHAQDDRVVWPRGRAGGFLPPPRRVGCGAGGARPASPTRPSGHSTGHEARPTTTRGWRPAPPAPPLSPPLPSDTTASRHEPRGPPRGLSWSSRGVAHVRPLTCLWRRREGGGGGAAAAAATGGSARLAAPRPWPRAHPQRGCPPPPRVPPHPHPGALWAAPRR